MSNKELTLTDKEMIITKPDQKNRTELLRILTKQKLEKELEEVKEKINAIGCTYGGLNPVFEKIAIHLFDKFKSTFWSQYTQSDLKYHDYDLSNLDKEKRVITISYFEQKDHEHYYINSIPIPEEFMEEFVVEVKKEQEVIDLFNSLGKQEYDIRNKLSNLPTTIQDISDHITVSEASQEDIDYVNKFIETI
jgi:hypothetical protein